METPELGDVSYATSQDVNIKLIASAVALVVFILVIIFCIKTYATQKHEALHDLELDSRFLETFCHDIFDNNLYALHLMSNIIKNDPNNLDYISSVLKHYNSNSEVYELFGWKEFIWLDENLSPRVSSISGVIHHPQKTDIQYQKINKKQTRGVFYGSSIANNIVMFFTLIAVMGDDGKTKGYIMIKYDISTLKTHFDNHRKNTYINFALIDKEYNVVVQSKPLIAGVGIEHGKIVNKYTKDLIRKVDVNNEAKAISYLDMVNGLNYYIKKINKEPFILLVNIDSDEIKNTILYSVIMKFLEIAILASFFLLMIISIYKRETWLREKAEKSYNVAIKATNAKSDFLAFTAHEIRSPLGFILTGSEIMRKRMFGAMPELYHEYAEGIYKNANLILDFVSDILDEEHIIAGNFKIVNTMNNVAEIIDNAVRSNMTRFHLRRVHIIQYIEEDLPKLVCDARRILQVMNNLISNGIKYSKDDTTLVIKAKLISDNLVIEIKDEGIGMSEAEIKIALKKYGTVRKKHFNFIESYGLGLPIVKLLLDAHQADFRITSKVNVGTVITITFSKYKLVYATPIGLYNET